MFADTFEICYSAAAQLCRCAELPTPLVQVCHGVSVHHLGVKQDGCLSVAGILKRVLGYVLVHVQVLSPEH